MTVSPQWPDEGEKSQFNEENAAFREPAEPLSPLPPTLFQLPDLRAENALNSGKTVNSDAASTPNSPEFEGWVAEMPFVAEESANDRHSTNAGGRHRVTPANDQSHRDDPPRFPVTQNLAGNGDKQVALNAVETNSDPVPCPAGIDSAPVPPQAITPAPTDVPAGRSWMDSIGSHGIVVALLLIVVAAALYTGRADDGEAADNSLGDGRDWLNYNVVGEVSLPDDLPAGTDIDGSSPVQDMKLGLADALGKEKALEQELSVDSKLDLDAAAPASSASLSRPVESNSGPASDFLRGNAGRGIANDPAHPMVAKPASSAGENHGREEAAPMRQTQQPTGYEIAVPATSGPVHQQTSTPSGIPDWSKYFPPLSSATSAEQKSPTLQN